MVLTTDQKRHLIQSVEVSIPISRRCELLGLSKSSYYYRKVPVADDPERLMKLLDQHYTEHPDEGKIKRARWLSHQVGYTVGKKRVATLMKKMGLEKVYPKPNTSAPDKKKYFEYYNHERLHQALDYQHLKLNRYGDIVAKFLLVFLRDYRLHWLKVAWLRAWAPTAK